MPERSSIADTSISRLHAPTFITELQAKCEHLFEHILLAYNSIWHDKSSQFLFFQAPDKYQIGASKIFFWASQVANL